MSSAAVPPVGASGAAFSWTELPGEFLGGFDVDAVTGSATSDLVGALPALVRGESYLAWVRYQIAYELYERLVLAREHLDGFVQDGYAECAARIAKTLAVNRYHAERMMSVAISLHELPDVAACLRDGIISDAHAQLITSRTDLIGEATLNRGSTPHDDPTADPTAEVAALVASVNADLSAVLRRKSGSWSRARLRDMVDRIVFRHDPDSVRERREKALEERGMWTQNGQDGTAELTARMSAENVTIAAAAVRALADTVCKKDPRTRPQRASDALFALLTGTRFDCQCGDADCAAEIPEPTTIGAAVDTKVVIHVVCDESTLDGTAANVGWVDGHGVISDEHVRDLAARPDAVVKHLVPQGTPENEDGTFTLSATQPADPYRPSASLDELVRVRDGYCVDPGCEYSAWEADVDHVSEYDHNDPDAGGQTIPENLNSKCRGDHLLKTHSDWVDDQYRDTDGRLRTEYTTPDGHIIDGEAETLEDFFPGLRRIRFTSPPARPPDSPDDRRRDTGPDNPTRRRTRVANKHARRRAERRRNRERRIREAGPDGPPPF